jgi:hypothetical protein
MGRRHSPEQTMHKLRQAEARLVADFAVAEAARELGISEATFYRRKNHYGAMSTSEVKRLKELRLPDPSTIRRGRGSREEGSGWRQARGARIGTYTLIEPGTENGVRPPMVYPLGSSANN